MTYQSVGHLVGRILIGLLFAGAAIRKITGYDEVALHMQEVGIPDVLLPLVILFEATAAIALIFNWKANYAALALAGFCIATAVLVHFDLSHPVERVMFAKNLALAGGLLILAISDIPKLRGATT